MNTDKKIDVTGIGNVLIDILARVTDEDIKNLGLTKGIMHLVGEEEQKTILSYLKNINTEMEIGGACPNTIRCLAYLGRTTVLSGIVAKDEYGLHFSERVDKLKMVNRIAFGNDTITGTSIILITPDGERTMNTNLGMCTRYSEKEVPEEEIKTSKYLFFTGYEWDTKNQIAAIRKASEIAKKNNTKIAFDLADPFCIKRNKDVFLEFLKTSTDIVFANANEAEMLIGKSLEENLKLLGELVPIAVIKNGAEGSYIISEKKIARILANKVNAIDTTGAGDIYAGGFLAGLTRGYDLEKCGKIASLCAEEVIQQIGARLPENLKQKIGE